MLFSTLVIEPVKDTAHLATMNTASLWGSITRSGVVRLAGWDHR
jgi:hypothetical protein